MVYFRHSCITAAFQLLIFFRVDLSENSVFAQASSWISQIFKLRYSNICVHAHMQEITKYKNLTPTSYFNIILNKSILYNSRNSSVSRILYAEFVLAIEGLEAYR